MTLKDLLRKRDRAKADNSLLPARPDFTFVRSDTNTQEVLSPPSFEEATSLSLPKDKLNISERPSRFRSLSATSTATKSVKFERRHLSERLHLRSHSQGSNIYSQNIPANLPSIIDSRESGEDREAQWEKRATILARGNDNVHPGVALEEPLTDDMVELSLQNEKIDGRRPASARSVSDAQGDVRTI